MNGFSRARVGVLGASGYAGREAIRLLAKHGNADVALASSESEAGAKLSALVRGAPELALTRIADAGLAACDAVLCCLPHGEASRWTEAALDAGAKVVDLSNDLRVVTDATPAWAREAVYGLPELHRGCIAGARVVANPGCYPTAAILALAPLLRRGLVAGPVIVDAASGVSGAGRAPKRNLMFAELAEDFSAYGVGNVHRHLAEMRDQAARLNGGATPELVFTPHLLPVKRGILETIYVPLAAPLGEPLRPWLDDYAGEPFVEVRADRLPALADVVGTNLVSIGVQTVAGVTQPMLIVVAAIDNLVKGAAGQAVQNLNLMFGFAETEGLT
ncbi:N-acetyl-gamma-glutamyl-phosphate reductase [Longimicrobium sp.]|uniref:N-acetyl-gamma-glutamyl-phosphate reductase n=1 Tax=Longimicrobium sp. TaxID=2029185 RepID=UPI002CFF9337|nr:N-acetyl-gamma-glutamyl-phosphate reductase [Longimicrobium sp.]HSU17855.1 N-acetyl-gamma-glutamyl-phosphate reductase [Longimicrobium sp.]